MCTSIIFSPNDHYFGRNFDYEMSFGQHLYFDAANEKGLGMAGLNYAGNAYYPEKEEG